MGFPVILLPKKFDVNSLLQRYGQLQAPPVNNNFIMGGNPFLNMMPPGSDAPEFTWLRYKCQGASMVCQGTNEEDANGDPINWAFTETQHCTDKNDKWPGAITMPNCNQQGRGTPLPIPPTGKETNGAGGVAKKVLPYVVPAALVVLVIAGVVWAVKKQAKG